MPANYWLLKTEPATYSFERLLADRKTNWNGVRNYQARNHLRAIAKGDVALIYHSGDEKSVVGIADVVRSGYPDLDTDDGSEWVQVDLAAVRALPNPVPLATIKSTAALKELPLIRHTRLSVMPVTKAHFETILKLAERTAAEPAKKRAASKPVRKKASRR